MDEKIKERELLYIRKACFLCHVVASLAMPKLLTKYDIQRIKDFIKDLENEGLSYIVPAPLMLIGNINLNLDYLFSILDAQYLIDDELIELFMQEYNDYIKGLKEV